MIDPVALLHGLFFTIGMCSFAAAFEFRDWRYLIGYALCLAGAWSTIVWV